MAPPPSPLTQQQVFPSQQLSQQQEQQQQQQQPRNFPQNITERPLSFNSSLIPRLSHLSVGIPQRTPQTTQQRQVSNAASSSSLPSSLGYNYTPSSNHPIQMPNFTVASTISQTSSLQTGVSALTGSGSVTPPNNIPSASPSSSANLMIQQSTQASTVSSLSSPSVGAPAANTLSRNVQSVTQAFMHLRQYFADNYRQNHHGIRNGGVSTSSINYHHHHHHHHQQNHDHHNHHNHQRIHRRANGPSVSSNAMESSAGIITAMDLVNSGTQEQSLSQLPTRSETVEDMSSDEDVESIDSDSDCDEEEPDEESARDFLAQWRARMGIPSSATVVTPSAQSNSNAHHGAFSSGVGRERFLMRGWEMGRNRGGLDFNNIGMEYGSATGIRETGASSNVYRNGGPSSASHFRYKIVCNLNCRYCSRLLCTRGMKAILLADTKVELYSTDMPPSGVALVNGDYMTDNCKCRIHDVGCLGCGMVVGYHVTQPCETCLDSCNNGHFWMFQMEGVAASERTDPSGAKPLLWAFLPASERDSPVNSLFVVCR